MKITCAFSKEASGYEGMRVRRTRRTQGRGGHEDRKGAEDARARPGAQSSAPPPRSSSSRPAVMMPEGRATTATPMSEEIMAMVRPTSEEG